MDFLWCKLMLYGVDNKTHANMAACYTAGCTLTL